MSLNNISPKMPMFGEALVSTIRTEIFSSRTKSTGCLGSSQRPSTNKRAGNSSCVRPKAKVASFGVSESTPGERRTPLITNSHVKGEDEYLFAPYSVFQVVSCKWSDSNPDPHEIVLTAALDNKLEEDNLPLAPWY